MRPLIVVVALAACGGKAAPEPADPAPPPVADKPAPLTEAQHLAALEDIAARGCACADAACILAVDADLVEVIEAVPVTGPGHDLGAAEVVGTFLQCVRQLAADAELPSFRAFVDRMDDVADAACACRDVACTDQILGGLLVEYIAYAQIYEAVLTDAIAPQVKRAEECIAPYRDQVANQAIVELTELRASACACKDAACADAVQADFDAFLAKHSDTKGNQEQAETIGTIAGEMSACLATAKGEPPP